MHINIFKIAKIQFFKKIHKLSTRVGLQLEGIPCVKKKKKKENLLIGSSDIFRTSSIHKHTKDTNHTFLEIAENIIIRETKSTPPPNRKDGHDKMLQSSSLF